MGRVICAGSINMDIVATAARHPAPGETVAGSSLASHPGGKGANQAVAAARMGARTVMLGSVGTDSSGPELLSFLSGAGVGVDHVRTEDGPTGTALIVVADAENTIVVVPGANGSVDADQLIGHARPGDVVVSQYEIPVDAVIACFTDARQVGATTVLNPAPAGPIPDALHAVTDIVVVNETELALLAGAADGDITAATAAGFARRIRRDPDQTVLVTLGAAGVVVVDADQDFAIPVRIVDAVDTTGAGDCFVGAVAAELASARPLADAVETATIAASICVTRPGAGPSMPTRAEVEAARRP